MSRKSTVSCTPKHHFKFTLDFCCVVTPAMDFVASDKYIYTGDSVELSCTVDMWQKHYPAITLATGESLDTTSHEEEHSVDGEYGKITDLWLYEQKELQQEYICTVNIYDGEEVLETLQKNVTIYSYSM